MAHDVFISYPHADKWAADATCAALETAGVRCWIAPRDITPGAEWGESIIQAIDGSRVMVLMFSSNANESRQVRREVERAVGRGVTIIPLRIEDIEPKRSLAYFLAGVHWLDALTPPLQDHLGRLAVSIRTYLQATPDHLPRDKPADGAPPTGRPEEEAGKQPEVDAPGPMEPPTGRPREGSAKESRADAPDPLEPPPPAQERRVVAEPDAQDLARAQRERRPETEPVASQETGARSSGALARPRIRFAAGPRTVAAGSAATAIVVVAALWSVFRPAQAPPEGVAIPQIAASAPTGLLRSVKIGVLTDLSGPFSEMGGPGSTVAAQMAVDDSGLNTHGWSISVMSADHQNQPNVGAQIASSWIDRERVDAIVDVPNSAVALAVNQVVHEKNAVLLDSGAATANLTGSACTPNTVHWTYDDWMLAHGAGQAIAQAGGKNWFFLTVDYAFGAELQRYANSGLRAGGGQTLGAVKYPLGAGDLSSFLLQAQSSKAQVIGLADAGSDTTNAIKQARQFGITAGGRQLAALLLFISDVHSLGLDAAQGVDVASAFYWDQNDGTRAFAKRFAAHMNTHAMPTMVQAGAYASILHYLRALAALGGDPHDGAAVVAKMKALQTDDPLFGKGEIRADGRAIHPAYLFKVKTPAESKGPWDYYKLIATIPANEAFRPLDQGGCPLATQ